MRWSMPRRCAACRSKKSTFRILSSARFTSAVSYWSAPTATSPGDPTKFQPTHFPSSIVCAARHRWHNLSLLS